MKWSCIVPSAFKGGLLINFTDFEAVRKTVRTVPILLPQCCNVLDIAKKGIESKGYDAIFMTADNSKGHNLCVSPQWNYHTLKNC